MTTLGSFFDILETNISSEPLSPQKLKLAENYLRCMILNISRDRYSECREPRFDLSIFSRYPGTITISLSHPSIGIDHGFSLVGCRDKQILGFELENLVYDFFGFPKMTKETMVNEICNVAKSIYYYGQSEKSHELFSNAVSHILDASLFYHREDKVPR